VESVFAVVGTPLHYTLAKRVAIGAARTV
jgi:hypothetical protein